MWDDEFATGTIARTSDNQTMRTANLILVAAAAFCTVSAIARAGENTLPNGVAAGDVDQTSAILWAHTTALGETKFEYSASPDFTGAIEVKASATNSVIPVKAEIKGLTPGTQYYYRVTDSAGGTAEGRFRTPFESGIQRHH